MKPIIEVHNLSKKYRIGATQPRYLSLRDSLTSTVESVKNWVNSDTPSAVKNEFWALQNIDFQVHAGESIGIIGRNGAGKSTLLKILSRITPPTKGHAILRGRLASLLEVGTGFHPELTGRENVYFNGSILGLRKAEIDIKFDEIVDFSGIERFIDTPLKNYSSGMQLRLAFAVAAHLEPEILIIDEVLAVGDAEFQKKCLGKMDEVSQSGRTVIFVSHNMTMIHQLCQKCILLDKGKIIDNAPTLQVLETYHTQSFNDNYSIDNADKDMYFKQLRMIDSESNTTNTYVLNQPICLEITLHIRQFIRFSRMSFMLIDSRNRRLFNIEEELSKWQNSGEQLLTLRIKLPANFLMPTQYSWICTLHIPNVSLIDTVHNICPFLVIDTGNSFSIYNADVDNGCIFPLYSIERQ